MPPLARIFDGLNQARDVVGVRPQAPREQQEQAQDNINSLHRLESTGEIIQTLPRGSLSQMATWSIL